MKKKNRASKGIPGLGCMHGARHGMAKKGAKHKGALPWEKPSKSVF